MNTEALLRAVKLRLEADIGSGGLFANGAELVSAVHGMNAPGNAEYPYLAVDISATANVDGFELDLVNVRFRVHTCAVANNGWAPVDAICQRIYGEASRTPTWGLHRHALTLAGSPGWATLPCRWDGRDFNSDEDHYHVIDNFETYMQRASA